MEEKKYKGYGYHGGGRPCITDGHRREYKTMSIAGLPAEIDALKEKARQSGKSVSRFVLDYILKDN